MAVETDKSPTLYLKHRGVFSKKELMDAIHNWFTDNRYKFHAPKYKIKSDEAEYEIKGEREVTEYVKYNIE